MGVFSSLRSHGFYGDYFTDRLLRIYSTWMFIILAVVVTVAMSGQGSINCWVPAHFTDPSRVFTEKICLSDDATLWTNMKNHVPFDLFGSRDEVPTVNVSRFQTFPVVLFFQALLFLLPWLLWKLISGGACNLDAMIREASRTPAANACGVQSLMGGHLQKLLCNPCSIIGNAAGGYVLSLTYLFMKFFYWIICFVQMAAIGAYFNIRFFTFKTGQQLWETYIRLEMNGNTTEISIPFPRKVSCDFQVMRLGNAQRYTVECMLGMTETIENCLNLIWIWMILILVILTLSGAAQFLHTILRCVRPMSYSKRFLKQRLAGVKSFNMASSEVIQKFVQMYLKPDMFFVIGMIEENGSISAGALGLTELWEGFLDSSKIHIDEERRSAEEVKPLEGPYTELQHEVKEAEGKV